MASHSQELQVKPFETSSTLKVLILALIGLGLISFGLGLFMDEERVWTSYLVSFFYFSCLGLGGLFFAAIQHITKAGWSSSIRRYAEAMTAFIPYIFVGGMIHYIFLTTRQLLLCLAQHHIHICNNAPTRAELVQTLLPQVP